MSKGMNVINDECLVFCIFRLRTMTESTWKILKLELRTPGFFSLNRVGILACIYCVCMSVCVSVCMCACMSVSRWL